MISAPLATTTAMPAFVLAATLLAAEASAIGRATALWAAANVSWSPTRRMLYRSAATQAAAVAAGLHQTRMSLMLWAMVL